MRFEAIRGTRTRHPRTSRVESSASTEVQRVADKAARPRRAKVSQGKTSYRCTDHVDAADTRACTRACTRVGARLSSPGLRRLPNLSQSGYASELSRRQARSGGRGQRLLEPLRRHSEAHERLVAHPHALPTNECKCNQALAVVWRSLVDPQVPSEILMHEGKARYRQMFFLSLGKENFAKAALHLNHQH